MVVIGAGAGGLCAAARLAHAGLHAIVVDDKDRVGGRASTEEIDGFKVNIGAIAIDPQSPKTLWVGTGEAWTRNSTSVGTGIYKSTDGGDSWTNMGLKDSERIAKILIDPVSLDFLRGAEIDFTDDLIGQAFKVNNPNATASCGCGTSFSV